MRTLVPVWLGIVIVCVAAPIVHAQNPAVAADSTTAPADTNRAPAHPPVAADSMAAPVDTVVHQPAPPKVDALGQVVALEQQRRAAMVAADTRTLAGIIAEDATYVHSTGMMQKRDELFRLLENKSIRYLSFRVEKAAYRVYGDAVIGTGVQKVEVMSGGKSKVISSRYTVIYTMRDGGEKMVAYQSTALPEIVTQSK